MVTDAENVSSPEWSPRTKRTVALLVLAAVVALLWFVQEILPLVIVSSLLAFLLHPMVIFFARRLLRWVPFMGEGARRGWAIILTYAVVLFGITVLILVIVPAIATQFEEFGRNIPGWLTTVEEDLEQFLSEPIMFNGNPVMLNGQPLIPLERIAEMTGTNEVSDIIQFSSFDLSSAAEAFLNSARSLTGPAFSFVGGAFNTLINLTLMLVMLFYLLKDGGRFVNVVVSLAPQGYERDAERLVRALEQVWNAYIRGQFILCVTMGVVVYFAALVLGLPGAPILGLLAGILEFIPNLGPLLALIPASLLALVSHSTTIPFLEGVPFAIAVIVTWTMLQNLEAIFLVPRIMGSSLDLHPLVVIVAVLGGAALAGPLGIILAAPFVASGRVIVQYLYGKLTDRDPFPEHQREHPPLIPPFVARQFARLRESVEHAAGARFGSHRKPETS